MIRRRRRGAETTAVNDESCIHSRYMHTEMGGWRVRASHLVWSRSGSAGKRGWEIIQAISRFVRVYLVSNRACG